jgi:hypothetical protein
MKLTHKAPGTASSSFFVLADTYLLSANRVSLPAPLSLRPSVRARYKFEGVRAHCG